MDSWAWSGTAPRLPPFDPTAERGRGLRLVEELADDWGFHLVPAGKVVWFNVRPNATR
jgi:hypothetical protein